MKRILIVVLAAFIMSAMLGADVYIKQKTTVDPMEMMGQKKAASESIQETWISDNAVAMISGSSSTIIDFGQKKLYIVQHEKKAYFELSLPVDMSKILPEMMAGIYAGMKLEATVTPTGEKKQVGIWNCDGYNVETKMSIMGQAIPMKQMVWATPDVAFDWKSYAEKMTPLLLNVSFKTAVPEALLNEMKKINGFAIYTDINMEMMGAKIHTVSEVQEIAQKEAPAGTYALPEGYAKKERMGMEDMQN